MIKVLNLQAHLQKLVQQHVRAGGDARDLKVAIQELAQLLRTEADPE